MKFKVKWNQKAGWLLPLDDKYNELDPHDFSSHVLACVGETYGLAKWHLFMGTGGEVIFEYCGVYFNVTVPHIDLLNPKENLYGALVQRINLIRDARRQALDENVKVITVFY